MNAGTCTSARPGPRWTAASLAALGLWVASAPVLAQGPAGGTLRVTGSSTMCPMIAAVAERYRGVRPEVPVEVECGGSDRGIKDVRDRSAQIGMVSRALRSDEKDLVGFPMARDGVSIIVHRSNPVADLSHGQIAGILSGRIGSWRPLNGRDVPIAVILREQDKPVTELVEKFFDLKGRLRGKVVPGDNPVTIAAVGADPAAIGYVSSGQAVREAGAGAAIRTVPVQGVLPTDRNVITGNYPLTRPLSLVTRALPTGAAKDFVTYCLSAKVVDLIERFDFVPYEE
ncbi:MAG TPA: phosphate ABC transporter substrate-binding protein [bacterium]